MNVIYKIQNTKTGMFSNGRSRPYFTKNGKIWKRPGDLTLHLNLVRKEYRDLYNDCEIVEFLMTTHKKYSVELWSSAAIARAKLLASQKRARHEEYAKRERWKQYQNLQKEFGIP